MDEAAWTKLLTEQGPLVAVLMLFIAASYAGKVLFAREFKALEDRNARELKSREEIIARQIEVVRENTRTTGEAVQALKEAVEAMRNEHRVGHDERR